MSLKLKNLMLPRKFKLSKEVPNVQNFIHCVLIISMLHSFFFNQILVTVYANAKLQPVGSVGVITCTLESLIQITMCFLFIS